MSQKVIVYFFGKCSLQNLIMTISYLQFSYYTHVFVTCILIGCRHAWLHPVKILTVWLGKWGQGWRGGEGWILSFAVENDNVLKILCVMDTFIRKCHPFVVASICISYCTCLNHLINQWWRYIFLSRKSLCYDNLYPKIRKRCSINEHESLWLNILGRVRQKTLQCNLRYLI